LPLPQPATRTISVMARRILPICPSCLAAFLDRTLADLVFENSGKPDAGKCEMQAERVTIRPASRRRFEPAAQTVSALPHGCGFTIRGFGRYDSVPGDGDMLKTRAKYHLGQVVRHRKHPFRGVIFDVDAIFSNTEEWYRAIPEESRPSKDQPFYHLLAENGQSHYVAYVSEQNLVPDYSGEPVDHPDLDDLFGEFEDGQYPLHFQMH
jgi:heat shock protein HspQ